MVEREGFEPSVPIVSRSSREPQPDSKQQLGQKRDIGRFMRVRPSIQSDSMFGEFVYPLPV
jgi:hypothetical protein